MERVKRQLGCSEKIQYSVVTEEISVAVLDTGIGSHPDFGGRILAFQDFVNGRHALYDDSGHGTHVAGCVGGSGLLSQGRFSGIAPACRLCVGKVLDEKGEGSIESMYHGLLWVLQNRLRYQIRVLNISVGIGENGGRGKMEELTGLLERVCESGVVVVCAAGNKGPAEGSLSPLGESRKVITVGCHEGGFFGSRKDLCEYYSGRGRAGWIDRKPDIVAPGTDIMSCNLHLQRDRRGQYRDAYVRKSGTSMATPIVSGAAALFLQKYPYCSSMQVKRRMLLSARDLGEAESKQGWGMLDIEKFCASY
ncbi:MAG: S8 family peptidase [Bacteroidales bacterium]|nr:S8 family peptidase [Bacteroidales bacterium]MCM1415937.1 S8 family peptidase [bacterium]MCM1424142.1 S8 family peptidase [bacterium]